MVEAFGLPVERAAVAVLLDQPLGVAAGRESADALAAIFDGPDEPTGYAPSALGVSPPRATRPHDAADDTAAPVTSADLAGSVMAMGTRTRKRGDRRRRCTRGRSRAVVGMAANPSGAHQAGRDRDGLMLPGMPGNIKPSLSRPAWWAPDGFAAIPTTALDLPLVQRLRRSPRFRVRVPIAMTLPARSADVTGAAVSSAASCGRVARGGDTPSAEGA